MIKKISKEALNYMKCKNLFIGLFILVLNISACASQTKNLNGKYISTFDSNIYYEFDGNNYSTSVKREDMLVTDSGNGTFVNEDGKITLYMNGDENIKIKMGFLYDEYIGSIWEGNLPDDNFKESYISLDLLEEVQYERYFKEDKTYEEEVIVNGEIVRTEHGTYTVSGDKVVCTSEEDLITTFINVEDTVFVLNS